MISSFSFVTDGKLLRAFALSWFVLALFELSIVAQSEPETIPPTEEEWSELRKRDKEIENELTKPTKYSWAGAYEWGSIGFVGAVLTIAPNSGYVYRPYSDTFQLKYIGGFDYGRVEIKDDRLILHSVRGNFGNEEFFPMTWGDRRLLVPRYRMHLLSNFLNAGCGTLQKNDDFGHLYFPTKRDQLKNKVFGVPKFPDEFKHQIMSSSVDLKVISVGQSIIENLFPESKTYPWRTKITKVVINGGQKNGLWEGMRLFVRERTNNPISVFITDVREDSADAQVVMSFNIATYIESAPTGPMVGWNLTSRIDDSWFDGKTTPGACRY